MAEHVILLSIPGLRESDVARMPNLARLVSGGDRATLVPSFPAVTCPVQCNMTTGGPPEAHGVVANGFFWRDRGEVEMWTAWNEVVRERQIWDHLHEADTSLTAAAWFPLLAKGCGADYVCTPAPIHNPDGSESLWCYTKPEALYGELRDALGHFPLQHFWGPLAGIQGTSWIVASAVLAGKQFRPNLFYVYLPHLDYAAQKAGPDSDAALTALRELDGELGKLIDGFSEAYPREPLWLVASEYAIVPVDHVAFPNRILREAGLLEVKLDDDGREMLDLAESRAWALADHQHAHVFVRDRDSPTIGRIADLFRRQAGIAEALAGDERRKHDLEHDRTGDVILISAPNSWQAYYWWHDDASAPAFARTVDIHRKPGYDPVELFFEKKGSGLFFQQKRGLTPFSVPLDATLVKGSHGAPATTDMQRGVLLASQRGVLVERPTADTDVADIVLRQFGI